MLGGGPLERNCYISFFHLLVNNFSVIHGHQYQLHNPRSCMHMGVLISYLVIIAGSSNNYVIITGLVYQIITSSFVIIAGSSNYHLA